jgi:hypothetical protein
LNEPRERTPSRTDRRRAWTALEAAAARIAGTNGSSVRLRPDKRAADIDTLERVALTYRDMLAREGAGKYC